MPKSFGPLLNIYEMYAALGWREMPRKDRSRRLAGLIKRGAVLRRRVRVDPTSAHKRVMYQMAPSYEQLELDLG